MKFIYSTIIKYDRSFSIQSTLFSGQTFRWNEYPYDRGFYCGVIGSSVLLLKDIGNELIEAKCTDKFLNGLPLSEFLRIYFSLDFDEKSVFSEDFRTKYPEVWAIAEKHLSTRIMRQEPFETMVTFMCAQGIGMALIRRQVSMIAKRYGRKLEVETGSNPLVLYAFPSPSSLASADPNELALCTNNNRIRAANIIAMARSFESGGMALTCVQSGECPLETLRQSLCVHNGIGRKIADCIALFGLGRFDAFPIDTHVKQYLWEWFGIGEAQRTLTEKSYGYLQHEARKILGAEIAGYAGHILFHGWRTEVKHLKTF
jgi:N-glycosylase/DNA lyase